MTRGTQPFPVNGMFADGLSIPFIDIAGNNLLSYTFYLAIVVLIGIYALTRKEIDRILQN